MPGQGGVQLSIPEPDVCPGRGVISIIHPSKVLLKFKNTLKTTHTPYILLKSFTDKASSYRIKSLVGGGFSPEQGGFQLFSPEQKVCPNKVLFPIIYPEPGYPPNLPTPLKTTHTP